MDAMLQDMEGGAMDLDVQAGRRDLAAIYRDDGPGLWRTIYAFTGGRYAATEDVVAEAFARALTYDGRIQDAVAWLYRVAFRLAQQELKDGRRRREQVETATPPPELTGLVSALRMLCPKSTGSDRAAPRGRYA